MTAPPRIDPSRALHTPSTPEGLQTERAVFDGMALLAATVAHELGNVLTTVSSAMEFLEEEDVDPEERQECIEDIRVAASRGRDLVQELAGFGRPMPPELGDASPAEVLEAAARRLEAVAPDGVQVAVELAPDLPRLRAPAGVLTSLLGGLGEGAVQGLGPAASKLRLGARAADPADEAVLGTDAVVLELADGGPPVGSEGLARAFEPFYWTKRLGRGRGLGLTAVKRVVLVLGGLVRVDAGEGSGTTVSLVLPAA